MHCFGVVVLASFTAIGGGAVRDVVLNIPVFWLTEPAFFYIISFIAIATAIYTKFIDGFPYRFWLVADAIGFSFFNLIGLEKRLRRDHLLLSQ